MEATIDHQEKVVSNFYHSVVEEQQRLNGLAMHYTKDPEEAQDLVQETIYKALANQDKFSIGTNLQAWLHTILRNTFRSQLKREKLQNQAFDTNQDISNLNIQDFTGGYSSMVMQEICHAIRQLRDSQRIPFELHLKGYKYQEIADMMNISIDNVKVRIHYARKQLREALKPYRTGIFFQ